MEEGQKSAQESLGTRLVYMHADLYSIELEELEAVCMPTCDL